MASENSKKITNEFLSSMKAEAVLPSLRIEYEEVGYWHGLWLKITRQKPAVKPLKLPLGDGDTVNFKRPYADELYLEREKPRVKVICMCGIWAFWYPEFQIWVPCKSYKRPPYHRIFGVKAPR